MAKPPIIIPITAAEKPIASVFLLHDVTGSTSAYEKDGFLEKFQGYTFFSVCQNDSSFSEDETLASLSEAYAKAIIEACPAGPYHLIGYSFGGILAIEVAQHLSEKRKEIGTITIVDTPPLERFIAAEYNIFLNFLLKLEVCLLNTDGFIKTIDEKEEEEDKTLLLERFFDYCSTQIRYGARRHQQEQQIKLLKYIRANLGLLFSSVQTPFSRSSFQNKVQLLSCQDTCQQYGLNSMLGWDEFGLNPNEKTCINLPKIDHFNLFSHEDSLTSLASAIKKKIRADKRDRLFQELAELLTTSSEEEDILDDISTYQHYADLLLQKIPKKEQRERSSSLKLAFFQSSSSSTPKEPQEGNSNSAITSSSGVSNYSSSI